MTYCCRSLFAAGLVLAGTIPSLAADRWEPAGSGAVAILPKPTTANGIDSGSLFCAEQKWAFLFRTSSNLLEKDKAIGAKVTISGQLVEAEARTDGFAATVPIPTASLDALKSGNMLAVEIGPAETGVAATFNLRGSKLTIEAVAPNCSQVDMSKFNLVELSETDPAIEQAKTVMAEEMQLFRAATGKQPLVSAKLVQLEGENRLLFASVCGSTNYYGPSGCTLAGYAQVGAQGEWRPVYNTEGVVLHTDPNAGNGGWPNLVTLPVMNGLEPTHWVWSGAEYELMDVVIAGDSEVKEEGDTAE